VAARLWATDPADHRRGLRDRRQEPSIRELYEIAELGKPLAEPTRAPQFMRLLVAPGQSRIAGEALDFRDEIMAQIYDRGDPRPQRTLRFDIEVTDRRQRRTARRSTSAARSRIGGASAPSRSTEAVCSYNGDFVLHVHHPTWRENRNDPATATRVGERKVR